MSVVRRFVVEMTDNFARNLDDIERFLADTHAPQSYDDLLDQLLTTVVPNLQRFADIGRPFLTRTAGSVEAADALATVRSKLGALTADADALREYILKNYVVLYLRRETIVYLLAIRHQRQLSFDFDRMWPMADRER